MNIAVTGASGFIGGRVVRSLHERGHGVHAYGRRQPEQLAASLPAPYVSWDLTTGPLANAPAVEVVVHCAARVDDWGSRKDFAAANIEGTRRVIESFPGARIIHISSASVYDPRAVASAHHEDDRLPTFRRDAYSSSKQAAELIVLASDRPAIVLRPHAVYGPGDTTLLPRLLRGYRFGRMFALGNGRNRVSLTHIDNLVHAVDQALARPSALGVFNVADAESASVDEILRCLLRALGLREAVTYVPARAAAPLASVLEAYYRMRRSPVAPVFTRYTH